MKKSVLVTGASGYIGRHTIKPLLDFGFEVHLVSRHPIESPSARWHKTDLLDSSALKQLMKEVKPTHLLHLAWNVEHAAFWTSEENRRWVTVTEEIMRAFADSGGQRFVGAGSCAEYQWSDAPLSEQSPLSPASLYGQTKVAAFEQSREFCRREKISFAWGRVFHSFGPFEDRRRLIPYLVTTLLSGRRAQVTDGKQLRDFLFIEDLSRAFAHLLNSDTQGAMNLASGNETTLRSLIKMFCEKMGKCDLVDYGARSTSPDDPAVILPDIEKLRSTGFVSTYSLEAAAQKTIDWWSRPENIGG